MLTQVAAAMISIVPGYISRSVAGSYDNEGIAIFCMLFTYYLWIKAVKTGQIYWATLCAVAYFYMVSIDMKTITIYRNWKASHFSDTQVSSWGGYVFQRYHAAAHPLRNSGGSRGAAIHPKGAARPRRSLGEPPGGRCCGWGPPWAATGSRRGRDGCVP